jgi:hypothetical protein
MADNDPKKYKELFELPSCLIIPHKQILSVETMLSLVVTFPKDKQKDAMQEIQESANYFVFLKSIEKKRDSAKLEKTAKTLMAAAVAIREISGWNGWGYVPNYAAMYFPDDCKDSTREQLRNWLELEDDEDYELYMGSYEDVQKKWENHLRRVKKCAKSLFLLGAFLEGIKRPMGRPDNISMPEVAEELRSIYNKYSLTKCWHAEAGTENSRGKKTPTKLGRFMLSVFEALGVETTSKALDQMLKPVPDK